jgi:uncharacterized protein YkwD
VLCNRRAGTEEERMFALGRLLVGATAIATLVASFVTVPDAIAAAPAASEPGMEQQLLDAVNADRVQAGVPPLLVDPRLSAIARQRDQYMIDHGFFSHCVDGQPACAPEQLHFGMLLSQAGLGGHAGAENLAANNAAEQVAASTTNSQWLNSPHHRSALMDPQYNATGLSALCCTTMQGAGGVRFVAEIFQAYPADVLAALQPAPSLAVGPGCQFVLGFQALHDLAPAAISECVDSQAFAANGDAQQHTTQGLLVWRKADNWTAFTNGAQTWINGPSGLVTRANTARFSWEANPQGLPLAG